ncbi:MAG: hypothetical protein ACXW3L_05420 [Limisphaerales bacterium]
MNVKSIASVVAIALAASYLAYFVATQQNVKQGARLRAQHAAEISEQASAIAALQQQLQAAEVERDHSKRDAAEIHKLRGELTALRQANEALQKNLSSHQQRASAAPPSEPSTPAAAPTAIPAEFQTHAELAQFAAGLRGKTRTGQLSPVEREWLERMKPQLDQLEASPKDFAEFQTAMIQSIVGVNEPEKVDQIRNTIERVTQAAVNRGLNLQSRPEDDVAWVEQRHQLDRRGTSAIQGLLDETQRAAFDQSFRGIIGVDLGTSVDKTLYPPGFIREQSVSR